MSSMQFLSQQSPTGESDIFLIDFVFEHKFIEWKQKGKWMYDLLFYLYGQENVIEKDYFEFCGDFRLSLIKFIVLKVFFDIFLHKLAFKSIRIQHVTR